MTRYWEFAQLSDHFKDVNLLDPVNGTGSRLYVGGIGALFRDDPDPLKQHNITHILSVLDFDVKLQRNLDGVTHLWVQIHDESEENLLKHFERTNGFVERGLKSNPKASVLVHCSMGVSRSATIVCAYFMRTYGLSAKTALERLQETRPRCQPNPGFLEQLDVYEKMLHSKNTTAATKIYESWMQKRGHSSGAPTQQSKVDESKL